MSVRSTTPNTTELPADYRFHTEVDLKANKKVATTIQLAFVAVAVAVVMAGLAFVLELPLSSSWNAWATAAGTVAACLTYMAVHELTHVAFLRMFSEARPTVKLRFPYLITGSQAYFNQRTFVVVALAPSVIWGVVLIVLLLTLPPQFFLTVYIVTALNFASSAGDYFQAYAFARLPTAALIQDDGAATRVYLPAT